MSRPVNSSILLMMELTAPPTAGFALSTADAALTAASLIAGLAASYASPAFAVTVPIAPATTGTAAFMASLAFACTAPTASATAGLAVSSTSPALACIADATSPMAGAAVPYASPALSFTVPSASPNAGTASFKMLSARSRTADTAPSIAAGTCPAPDSTSASTAAATSSTLAATQSAVSATASATCSGAPSTASAASAAASSTFVSNSCWSVMLSSLRRLRRRRRIHALEPGTRMPPRRFARGPRKRVRVFPITRTPPDVVAIIASRTQLQVFVDRLSSTRARSEPLVQAAPSRPLRIITALLRFQRVLRTQRYRMGHRGADISYWRQTCRIKQTRNAP